MVHVRGEMMDSHNAGGASLLWELSRLGESSVDVLQTSVAEPRVAAIRGHRRAYGHAESLSMLDYALTNTCESHSPSGRL